MPIPFGRPVLEGRRLAVLTVALTLLLASVVGADETGRIRLVVNGEEMYSPVVPAQRVGSEVLIPVFPLASKLQVPLEFDPASLDVTVTDPIRGDVLRYEGTSGLIRRNGVIELGLAAGLPQGSSVADLLLPLPLVTALFDLDAEIALDGSTVSLISRVGAAEVRASRLGWAHFQELGYRGYANRYDDLTDAGITLETRSRVERGSLESSMLFQGQEERSPVLRSATVTYRHASRNIWSAGDFRGTGDLGWMVGVGRGGRWTGESVSGDRRFGFSAFGILAGTQSDGSRIGTPDFDGMAYLAEYSVGARSGAASGIGFGLGGGWLGRTSIDPQGLLTVAETRFFHPRVRGHARAGLFGAVDDDGDNGYGLELQGTWTPSRKVRVGTRLFQFDQAFRLPRFTLPERNNRYLSIDALYTPNRRVQLSASSSYQRRVNDAGEGGGIRVDNASAALFVPSLMINTLRVSASQFEDSLDRRRRDLSVHTGGGLPVLEWRASLRHRWQDLGSSTFGSFGLISRNRAGRGQLTTTWERSELTTVGMFWSLPPLMNRRLYFSIGQRWEKLASLDGKHLYGQFRAAYQIGSEHHIDLTVEETQSSGVVRLSFNGTFDFPDAVRAGLPEDYSQTRWNTGIIRGRIYLDHNMNQKFDSGDRPLEDVMVLLDAGSWRAVTGGDGRFEFPRIEAGEHDLRILAETIRADLTLVGPLEQTVLLPAYQQVDIDIRVGRNRTVSGYVFEDLNRNGRRDKDEPGVANVRLFANADRDALTFPDGSYRLGDLAPGVRLINIDRTSIPERLLAPETIEVRIPVDENPDSVWIALSPRERSVIRNRFDWE